MGTSARFSCRCWARFLRHGGSLQTRLFTSSCIGTGVFCAGSSLPACFVTENSQIANRNRKHLTTFYLMVAIGGAFGSFVGGHRRALVAASIFRTGRSVWYSSPRWLLWVVWKALSLGLRRHGRGHPIIFVAGRRVRGSMVPRRRGGDDARLLRHPAREGIQAARGGVPPPLTGAWRDPVHGDTAHDHAPATTAPPPRTTNQNQALGACCS